MNTNNVPVCNQTFFALYILVQINNTRHACQNCLCPYHFSRAQAPQFNENAIEVIK